MLSGWLLVTFSLAGQKFSRCEMGTWSLCKLVGQLHQAKQDSKDRAQLRSGKQCSCLHCRLNLRVYGVGEGTGQLLPEGMREMSGLPVLHDGPLEQGRGSRPLRGPEAPLASLSPGCILDNLGLSPFSVKTRRSICVWARTLKCTCATQGEREEMCTGSGNSPI